MALKINALLTPELDLGEWSASLLNSYGQTNILTLRRPFFSVLLRKPASACLYSDNSFDLVRSLDLDLLSLTKK